MVCFWPCTPVRYQLHHQMMRSSSNNLPHIHSMRALQLQCTQNPPRHTWILEEFSPPAIKKASMDFYPCLLSLMISIRSVRDLLLMINWRVNLPQVHLSKRFSTAQEFGCSLQHYCSLQLMKFSILEMFVHGH